MKVLHVNAFDSGGGAARAAMRLHRALRCIEGIDSQFLTVRPSSSEEGIFTPLGKRQVLATLAKRHAAVQIAALQKTPTNLVIHSLGLFASGLGNWINDSDFDLVNLHWVAAETLSIPEIARIKKPIVWTMHDMWPFMGAEHYDDLDHPGRWKEPYISTNRPPNYRGPDLDARVWARKARAWAGATFQMVAPSQWIAGCATGSALMRNQPCTVIPNPLDTESFAPVDRNEARRMIGLPLNKNLILFGALGATSDPRKGYDLLVRSLKAFERMHRRDDVEIVVFGGRRDGEIPGLRLKSHFLGSFHDDLSLRLVYSAADVFVAPSRQDNLPNTVVEAGACGVPTVAFDIGGMSDIVINEKTGVLVPPFDTEALADGIKRLLRTPIERERVRKVVVSKVGLSATLPAYQSLYKRVLGRAS